MPTGAHFLRDDVAAFDANFFGISANEAKAMDPQQRIMLEIAYEAFENAALSIEAIAGTNTSCYVGNFTTDYKDMLFRDPESNSLRTISGIGAELIANRISWFYDLRGSSVTVNTACSSSLVAFHHGYQSLRTKESSMALIGGSNLLLNPDYFQAMSKQHFLARDGLSKSFDAKGDGYGRGEGFAAVILKRFNDAIRDGDPIRAVIRGSGVNQDGKTKGITVPSLESQADLIRSTYRSAGLDFKDTHYCEAHVSTLDHKDTSRYSCLLGYWDQSGRPDRAGGNIQDLGSSPRSRRHDHSGLSKAKCTLPLTKFDSDYG